MYFCKLLLKFKTVFLGSIDGKKGFSFFLVWLVSVWVHFWGLDVPYGLAGQSSGLFALWEVVKGGNTVRGNYLKHHNFALLLEFPDDGKQNPSQSLGI